MGRFSMGEEQKRKEHLYLARLAENAGRHEDMVANMKAMIDLGYRADELSQEERNLISVAYKNMMSFHRMAWRTVQSLEEDAGDASDHLKQYKNSIAQEICAVVDKVTADVVKPFTEGPLAAKEPENLVFFYKMEGDYYRYGAEILEGDQRSDYLAKGQHAYNMAKEVCTGEGGLPSTNPIWLGLALNFSVFYYEICGEKEEAKRLAKFAFEEALTGLDSLAEESYKDSSQIMQLLKENLSMWTEEDDDDAELEVEDM